MLAAPQKKPLGYLENSNYRKIALEQYRWLQEVVSALFG
jgi:hypothetical protein